MWINLLLGVVVIALALLLVFWLAFWRFNRSARRDAEALLADAADDPPVVVTEEAIRALPDPIQRLLTYSGVVGKPIPRTVRLRQIGKIRMGTNGAWMPLVAHQHYTTNPPGFVWNATVKMNGLPMVKGEDQYRHGQGRMFIKLAALKTLVNATGKEMDQGAFMRYLSEMIWFPAAFLAPNITWKYIDDHAAEATLTDQGKSVSGVFHVDDEGRIVDFVTQRYREVNGSFSLATWYTPATAYGEFQGLRIPVHGPAIWKLPEGDQEYIDVEITELEYDAPAVY